MRKIVENYRHIANLFMVATDIISKNLNKPITTINIVFDEEGINFFGVGVEKPEEMLYLLKAALDHFENNRTENDLTAVIPRDVDEDETKPPHKIIPMSKGGEA